MKQINSILRTLCLMALLCMTSVNASAYKIYDGSFDLIVDAWGTEKILVIDRNVSTDNLNIYDGYAVIIKAGITVTVNTDFSNSNKLYVFGFLDLSKTGTRSNTGTIYKVDGGTIDGGDKILGRGNITDVSLEDILSPSPRKLSGQEPEPGKSGWRDYWAKGISEDDDDFYPMCYYEDEECEIKIEDLEEWKNGEGQLCVLQLGDNRYIHNGSFINDDVCFIDKVAYDSNVNLNVTGKITYSRTFKNTNWQPLYVPFAMEYDDWIYNFEVATINNFHEYTDDMGQTVKTELEVRLVKSGKLKPNHPYLIRAHIADATNPQEINISNKKMYKSDENSIVCSSVERKYTFTGTYRDITGMRTKDYIFLSDGKLCRATDDNVKLSAQRWYLSIESLGSQVDGANTSYAKPMEFDIRLLDDETTDIDEITVTRTPLQNSSEAMYNLNGMRVNDSYKGIVIKNGKKMLKR